MKPTTGTAVDSDEYCSLMSGFPTGVVVVTGLDVDLRPCGMTCSSMCSVTLDPPILLVSLRLGSRTAEAVRDRGVFAVNLLDAAAERTAQLFAAPVEDRFSHVSWEDSPGGLPWLSADAFAVADCVVADTVVVGDHAVIFGRVERTVQSAQRPLLFGLRRFRSWESLAAPLDRVDTDDHRREENR